MKKYCLLLVLVLCLVPRMQAQHIDESEIRETERQIADGTLSYKETAEFYNKMMHIYGGGDIEKARYYFEKGLTLAREHEIAKDEAMFIIFMSQIYLRMGAADSVLIYLDRALEITKGKEEYNTDMLNCDIRGIYYCQLLNDYESGRLAFQKSLELNEKDKQQRIANKESVEVNVKNEVVAINNISNIYGFMNNIPKQIEYMERGLQVINDNPDFDFRGEECYLYGNLGKAYLNIHENENAFPYIEKAYTLSVELEEREMIVYSLMCYASYYGNSDHKRAIDYAEQALQMGENLNSSYNMSAALNILSEQHLLLKDYKKALGYAKRSLELTPEDAWRDLQEIHINMALIYAAMGNIEQAFVYLTSFKEFTGKLSDETMHSALQEMEVKYDVQQKELEIVRQQAEIGRQQTRQYLLVGGLLVAVLLLALLAYIIVLRTRRNRMLAETNATKDRFFSIISHDLKNPAIAQRDALQLLTEHAGQWDADSLSQYYSELLRSADGQVELLYNLLNWAQVQTGRMPYHPVMFDLATQLRSDITLIRNMAERKGCFFEVRIPDEAIVTGDSNMIATVVRNLLTNAVKFTGEGGMVSLEITPGGENKYTVLVSDTGTGMTRAQLEGLFDIDHSRSRCGTAGEQGSGLGLIVCREFIEKHGSTLRVESEEGKGSRFRFVI